MEPGNHISCLILNVVIGGVECLPIGGVLYQLVFVDCPCPKECRYCVDIILYVHMQQTVE